MNKKDLAAILALGTIAQNNPDGFTVNAKTFAPINKGYAVALKDTQNSFNFVGLASVYQFVKNHPEINAVGGWFNSDNGRYYFDATIICNNLSDALELGKVNEQIAIFDLNNCEEIRL